MPKNFSITPSILLQWYTEYNRMYFNNSLPVATLSQFAVKSYSSRLGCFSVRSMGGVQRWTISETNYFEMDERDRRHTLLHEMCHLACYVSGYKKEHHGPHWQAIAAKISDLSGFDIRRIHQGSFPVAEAFREKQDRKKRRKMAAYAILVFPYEADKVWIVKTTARVIAKSCMSIPGSLRLNTHRQPERLFLSDAFPSWKVRKSLRWGNLFKREDYEDNILPRLKKGREFKSIEELIWAA